MKACKLLGPRPIQIYIFVSHTAFHTKDFLGRNITTPSKIELDSIIMLGHVGTTQMVLAFDEKHTDWVAPSATYSNNPASQREIEINSHCSFKALVTRAYFYRPFRSNTEENKLTKRQITQNARFLK